MSMATGRCNHQSLLENCESEGNRGSAIVPKNCSICSECGILSEMPQKRVKNYVRKLFNEKDYIPKDFEFIRPKQKIKICDRSPSSHYSIMSTIVDSKIEDKITSPKLSDFKIGTQNNFIKEFRINRKIKINESACKALNVSNPKPIRIVPIPNPTSSSSFNPSLRFHSKRSSLESRPSPKFQLQYPKFSNSRKSSKSTIRRPANLSCNPFSSISKSKAIESPKIPLVFCDLNNRLKSSLYKVSMKNTSKRRDIREYFGQTQGSMKEDKSDKVREMYKRFRDKISIDLG